MDRLVILGHSSRFTTARYFERAAKNLPAAGVQYVSDFRDFAKLEAADCIFVVDPLEDWPLGFETLPGLKIAYLIDVHVNFQSRSDLGSWCDLLFVAQQQYVKRLAESGHRHVRWLPLAADPQVHFAPGLERRYDVGFIGQLGPYGTDRFNTLNGVLPLFRTNDYRKWQEPEEMGRIYSQSKIVFNASVNGDLNMRVFEALCSGALLVTDRVEDLGALFAEGEHFVGYSSVDEAIEKIRYFLDHPKERIRIAEAGQRALFSQHTYTHRLQYVMQVATGADFRGSALVNSYSQQEIAEAHANVFRSLRKPGGILSVIRRYGISFALLGRFLRTCGAWVSWKARSRLPIRSIRVMTRRLRAASRGSSFALP